MPFHACNWGSTPHGDANNKNRGLALLTSPFFIVKNSYPPCYPPHSEYKQKKIIKFNLTARLIFMKTCSLGLGYFQSTREGEVQGPRMGWPPRCMSQIPPRVIFQI
jgi:hypothetical protein